MSCLYGNMTNQYNFTSGVRHDCVCEQGWRGRACDMCTTAASCRPFYNDTIEPVCDKTPVIINYKTFSCNGTDPQLAELGIYNLTLGLQISATGLAEGKGVAELQVWIRDGDPPNDAVKEAFYCELFDCSTVGTRLHTRSRISRFPRSLVSAVPGVGRHQSHPCRGDEAGVAAVSACRRRRPVSL